MVFVVGSDRKPLDMCDEARARRLLKAGRASILRRYPLTIILRQPGAELTSQDHRLKIDPGSKTTGLALLRGNRVVWAAELHHRGQRIRDALFSRRQLRRGRRSRKTRYRKARFLNRRRREGWLPPSLESRIANVTTWVERLRRLAPIVAISMELVRFDTQLMQNPEISGVEYQQGELQGYEVREYLLEKWGRKCAYCGKKDVPLEVEHIIPKSRGGTNRVSNLSLACTPCNQAKNRMTAAEFGHPEIQKQAKAPLKDTAAVNATRWELYRRLQATGLPVEVGTGGRTKYNRIRLGLPKAHWLDAACVGASTPDRLDCHGVEPLIIKAMGHGKRQRCQTDKYGFPKAHAKRAKRFMGFATGDIVRAKVPKGKAAGEHFGRVVIRFRPAFRLNGYDVHPKYMTTLHKADGYEYVARSAQQEETHGTEPDAEQRPVGASAAHTPLRRDHPE